jgi:APA family basic amino acid/polyamine antiporter
VANLILEYILANAAAIRGFSPYFAMLVNKDSKFFILPWTSPMGTTYALDW